MENNFLSGAAERTKRSAIAVRNGIQGFREPITLTSEEQFMTRVAPERGEVVLTPYVRTVSIPHWTEDWRYEPEYGGLDTGIIWQGRTSTGRKIEYRDNPVVELPTDPDPITRLVFGSSQLPTPDQRRELLLKHAITDALIFQRLRPDVQPHIGWKNQVLPYDQMEKQLKELSINKRRGL